MKFGKNRVQYREFLWQFYRFDKFDTYYYVNGKELAEFTAQIASEEIPKYESYFQHPLEKRITFIIYNKLSDFKQSNIGLVSDGDENNIGGVTEIVNNKVFLYFDGDRNEFKTRVREAIIEVVMNEMLYGTNIKDKLANSTLLVLPDWFSKGLISYLANDWNFKIENEVKDGILSGRYEKFNRLSGKDAQYAGHSIWKYIADQYGKGIIPNIVYLTRVHKKAEDGLLFVLGISFESLAYEWIYYYKEKYTSEIAETNDPGNDNLIFKNKRRGKISQPKISPDNKYIAWVTNDLGQYKIWLYDNDNKKKKRLIKKEHKLDQITDFSFPLIAWHPSGKILSYITESKGKILLSKYNIETKKTEITQMFNFEKILDFSYSDDGLNMVMSATKKGYSDIYIHNLAAHTNKQITNDFADDINPQFINNSNQLIFSSNRKNNQIDSRLGTDIETNLTYDIFIYDIENESNELKRITNTLYVDEKSPYAINSNLFTYISDETGIYNRFIAYIDSSINYIDTITHYRYFTVSYPITDYSRNISEYNVNKNGDVIELLPINNVENLFTCKINKHSGEKIKSHYTIFRKEYTNNLIREDSLGKAKLENIKKEIEILNNQPAFNSDDTLINITNYVFEQEKVGSPVYKELLLQKYKEKEFVLTDPKIYHTAFYPNYLVNQIDFSFLNASYQTFTESAVYYNPGMNFFFKLGINELFEDYKLTGGVRLSTDLESNEYLISFENLKEKTDKQILFHRQTYNEIYTDSALKSFTHELMFIRKYPFSQVSAIKGTLSLRYDKNVILSSDNTTLLAKNSNKKWGGFKLEYIFDNTIPKGLNLYNGLRFKIFSEAYWEVEKNTSDLYVLGADFRYYQPLHRDIIWASRMALSSSFGRSRLIYYLGSVDNWFSFLSSEDVFNKNIAFDRSQNFVYQTLATNMRGFSQNIRNGNSFVLLNNEIRVPVIKYFARRPVTSDLLANFQAIGFFDIGTAWSGPNPYSRDNAYNFTVKENGPITVTLNKDIQPTVFGYGFGVRTRMLGYFVRADWAWGVQDYIIQPRIFYLSLSTDF